MKQHDVIHETGSTKRIATPSEEDQATATGNMHKIVVKFGRAVFELCVRTDRQTVRQTDILITILTRQSNKTLLTYIPGFIQIRSGWGSYNQKTHT